MRVIGLSGWSGAGKTTLLGRVIPYLIAEGLTVSTIKHAHSNFDLDVPGKDSWIHRQAGATEVLHRRVGAWLQDLDTGAGLRHDWTAAGQRTLLEKWG